MLPNLIIIGGQKCGTTSLHDYLRRHPQIFMSREKELNFFCPTGHAPPTPAAETAASTLPVTRSGVAAAVPAATPRTVTWYESQFPQPHPIRGEASPLYTCHPPSAGVAARMHALLPDAKLIYLVRDPIARILSHYVHWVSLGQETRSFAAALATPENNPYLDYSRYATQAETFLAHYRRDQLLIIVSEDLRQQRAATLQQIFRFLGVDDAFTCAAFRRERYRARDQRQLTRWGRALQPLTRALAWRGLPAAWRWRLETLPYRPFSRPVPLPALPEETRRRLADWLRPEVERLRKLLGRDFREWQV